MVFFKKPGRTLRHKLCGLQEDSIAAFFTDLFIQQDKNKRKESVNLVTELVGNALSMVIAITTQELDGSYILIACVLFHPDNDKGSFIPFLGVLDQNVGNAFKLNDDNFEVLPDCHAQGWQGKDLANFLLSMVQFTTTMLFLCKHNNKTPQDVGH